MISSQIVTYSGNLETAIDSEGMLEDFLTPLQALNGNERFSVNLSHMPTPKWPEDLTDAEIEEMSRQYLQCAGNAEAMTCEISKVIEGEQCLFTIGHRGQNYGEPTVPITYANGQRTLYVYPSEVFGAIEAAELFFSYHKTQDIPHTYELRRIGP